MLQAILLYPPITDATSPYHSLVYLASFARSAGFRDVAIRDTNIEALNYCARPEIVSAMTAEWRGRRRALGSRASLAGLDQLEYFHLVKAEAITPDGVSSAIETLRDPVRFYNYSSYKEAAERLGLWLESLSCSGWPGQFETGGQSLRRSGWLSLSSIADLTNEPLLARLTGPFVPYFENELFPALIDQAPGVVGINITYTSQLPFALWMVRRIRRIMPDAFIVCGGTEVSGVWKYLADQRRMIDLFDDADACVIGEGETAFVRILEERLDSRPPGPIENVVRFNRRSRTTVPPPAIRYEDLEALPMPDYSLMDNSLYFSPHPLVYYSPTRGCYWNKCTFCDYGLNFGTPTSPWRQISVERSVGHLQAITAYSRHVYLSVDVLAPSRVLQLAEAVADAGIDIRWAAEIRLERYFTEERCRALHRSGCVALSVGFESGSQRVLDLIDKGITLADIRGTIRNFSSAGIAVQMMGFTGFPSETREEALASVRFLKDTEQWWNTSALGSFLMTSGAIVARTTLVAAPGSVVPLGGDDIVRMLYPARSESTAGDEAFRAARKSLLTADFDRPFAGGIDTAHSIFFYDYYGRLFPRAVIAKSSFAWRYQAAVPLISGAVTLPEQPFDLIRASALLDAAGMRDRAVAEGQALCHAAFMKALDAVPLMMRKASLRHFIVRNDGVLLPCPQGLLHVLEWANGQLRAGELEERIRRDLNPAEIGDLIQYADALEQLANRDASGNRDRIRAAIESIVNAGILRPSPDCAAETHLASAKAREMAVHSLIDPKKAGHV